MKRPVYILALAAIVGFGSCGKSDSPDPTPTPPSKTKVMFTNSVITADGIGVKVNDTIVDSAANLSYLKHTAYTSLTPGSQSLAFFLASSNSPLTSTTANFSANSNYSVFSTGQVTAPGVLVVSDDLGAPAAGKAKVRFINLSPDNLNMSFYLVNTKIDSNVSYLHSTSFALVNAGTVKVTVGEPNNLPSAIIENHDFLSGKIYTIILTGAATSSSNFNLKLTEIKNN